MSYKVYYLSIGSNIDPAGNITKCLALLKARYPSIRFSTVYETDPVGPAGTQKFWNLAAAIQTPENLSEESLRHDLRQIETQLGRVRSATNRFMPRVIDIDILPQEGYTQQAFIMIPLAEIAPDGTDSITGKTFYFWAENLKSSAAGFKKVINSDLL